MNQVWHAHSLNGSPKPLTDLCSRGYA